MSRLRPPLVLVAAAACGAALACGPRPMPPAGYAAADVRAFVTQHRAELESEIAIGSGPGLYDLSTLAGCQDVPEVGRTLHKQYREIFDSETTSDAKVAERMVDILGHTRELRCLGLDLSRQSEFSAGRRHIGPGRSHLSVLRQAR
jgi:hypothetical protein